MLSIDTKALNWNCTLSTKPMPFGFDFKKIDGEKDNVKKDGIKTQRSFSWEPNRKWGNK